jgi:DNA-3-methyladenine glycosylase
MNTMLQKLPLSFYQRGDVVQIAKELLGKILITRFPEPGPGGKAVLTAGRIIECEAYNGITDRASHAYGGRRTPRNEIMYADGGVAYVYLCYGIHHLFNVVTNVNGIPHAVLIRALEPLHGIDQMLLRTGKKRAVHQENIFSLTRGPGNLSRAMGITVRHSGYSLQEDLLCIAEDGLVYAKSQVAASPRVGVAYAGPDAQLPYRFFVKGNPYVSGNPK